MLDHRYHTFLTLARTGSYTQTADELFITQPAVTQQIKSLEKEVGFKLVTYRRPILEITPEGQKLAEFISKAEVQSQQLLDSLRVPVTNQTLVFSATMSTSEILVPELMMVLKKQGYQQIDCHVVNTQTALEEISSGTSQFALIEGNFDKQRFGYRLLRREPFVGVASSANPVVRNPDLGLTDLTAMTLLLREEGSGTRDIFRSIATAQNLSLPDFKQVITIADPTAIRELLLRDAGISFLYESVVKADLASGQLARLPMPNFKLAHDMDLVWLKGSPFESTLIQLIQDHMAVKE
ncbi:LysR family transcriptional regulator [Levilactobacillus bambusae]|uniref:LysR family transcriptional regulator n=1 Tax=Levilactobacillus bambusae TaxID=2024736 RepID=A0A2V1MZK3_9LACO|nr:LysR family transcriptional regulator [Levilactobacillus bambusae]PWG00193.1 LysR family transcriptional regulator [Levilactobacillus bambusae]